MNLKGRDLVSLENYSREEIEFLFDVGMALKRKQKIGEPHRLLRDKTLGMIFETPSTRTSISFETAMTQLGGHAQYLSQERMWLGKEETIEDTGSVLSRYVDGVIARTQSHQDLLDLAEYASIPVINASTGYGHPCQALADFMTVKEKKGNLDDLKYATVWGWHDANAPMGLVNSTLYTASAFEVDYTVACPEGYEPTDEVISTAKERAEVSGSDISIGNDREKAVEEADVINVYMWAPPEIYEKGIKEESSPHLQNPEDYKQWQVNQDLVERAKDDAIVMHCMPAGRGQEVTAEVLDGPQSVILDEAENRLHIQKGILTSLI